MDDAHWLAWGGKAAVYGFGQLAIGVALVWWLSPRPSAGEPLAWHERQRWLARLARIVALLLVAGLLLRVVAQAIAAFGPAEAFTWDSLSLVALRSRWGAGWRIQMVAAGGLVVAALLTGASRMAWSLFTIGALAVALTTPLVGHAAGSIVRQVVHGLHYLGTAAWLGTLGVITLSAWRFDGPGTGAAATIALTRRFSPLALTAATVAALTGTVAAVTYIGTWDALWSTTYGRVLLAKLVGVLAILACGGLNWRSVRRGDAPSRLVMTAEWLLAVAVIALTGVLTEVEHP